MVDLPDKVSFASEEEKIQELWTRLDAFKTSLKLSEGKPEVNTCSPVGAGYKRMPHLG